MAPTGPPDDDPSSARPDRGATSPRPPWAEVPGNPRTEPTRPRRVVEAEVALAEAQRAELEDMMARTGQGDALLVAPVEAVLTAGPGAHTSTTWIEGRICVLARTDVVVLFAQPRFIGAEPTIIRVRWDVVARVCGADCWNPLPDIEPRRVVTRRWPSEEQVGVLANLSLEPPSGP